MSWLAPLGFMGLLGIAVLILIYILKPNYQQKFISSTYVWKLSLKYRKKRIPISRLRNLLIIICQILIITACAMILAEPVIKAEIPEEYSEKVVVIDASANMRTTYNEETRFERAVSQVKSLAGEVLAEEGNFFTVILADDKAHVVGEERYTAESLKELYAELDELVKPRALQCSYGDGDIDGAMALAQYVLEINPQADVMLYTATTYIEHGSVTIVDVSDKRNEWNVGVLDCVVTMEDNSYVFSVDVACYGIDKNLTLYCDIIGANADGSTNVDGSTIRLTKSDIWCNGDETQTVTFNTRIDDDRGIGLYSYKEVHIYVKEDDSYAEDNDYYLYGGTRETIKVQYYSSDNNLFFNLVLQNIQDAWASRADIIVDGVRQGAPAMEGYDLYIFEHKMPTTLPTDGVVLLVDPDIAPEGSDLTVANGTVNGEFTFASGKEHPLTEYVVAEQIMVTYYKRITSYVGYEELMYCGGDPVLLVKNEPRSKVVVLSCNLNFSDSSIVVAYPTLMRNIFNYFFPVTIVDSADPDSQELGNVFDIGDTLRLTGRTEQLKLSGENVNQTYESFPCEITFSAPGVYTVTQSLISGKATLTESFYIKTSATQSNIFRVVDSFAAPTIIPIVELEDNSLLVYFAAALVALLFLEWWLQSRENF